MKQSCGVSARGRWLLAAAMTLRLAAGQYSSAAISANGSRVFFESPRSLRGVTWEARGRIYEALPAGSRLVAEPPEAMAATEWVESPQVSDSGDVVAWTAMKEVTTNFAFVGPQKTAYATAIVRRESDGATWTFPGGGSLSRNGRWFASTRGLVDLTAGATPAPLAEQLNLASDVADDGSFVVFQDADYRLRRADGSSVELPGLRGTFFRIDRMAGLLVNTVPSPPIAGALPAVDVLAYQVATGESRVLVSRCLGCEVLSVSGDGSHLLLRGYSTGIGTPGSAALQLYWVDAGNGEARRLSSEVTDVLAGAVRDGGQVLLGTALGELRCSGLSGEGSWVAVPATPHVVENNEYGVPGTRYVFHGRGLQRASLVVGSTEARIVNRDAGSLTFVVPEETPEGPVATKVESPGSPFAPQVVAGYVLWALPSVIRLIDLGETMDASDNWPFLENGTRGGLVSDLDPVRPGEELWVHMTGLGRDPLRLTYQWDEPPMAVQQLSVESDEVNPGWQVVKLRVPPDSRSGQVVFRVFAQRYRQGQTKVPVAAP